MGIGMKLAVVEIAKTPMTDRIIKAFHDSIGEDARKNGDDPRNVQIELLKAVGGFVPAMRQDTGEMYFYNVAEDRAYTEDAAIVHLFAKMTGAKIQTEHVCTCGQCPPADGHDDGNDDDDFGTKGGPVGHA